MARPLGLGFYFWSFTSAPPLLC